MNIRNILIIGLIVLLGCKSDSLGKLYLTEDIPGKEPIAFNPVEIPSDQIVHKGMFSPDLKQYYYTVSDKNYENFHVYVLRNEGDKWSEPDEAFFNSQFNDHGMSFSPDGKTLYFSSTRPVEIMDVSATWHLWKSEEVKGKWSEPVYVDIPNLRDKLISHPTITKSGALYFHSSDVDYTRMDIYSAHQNNGKFGNAERVNVPGDTEKAKCTPFISPDGSYLIYAVVGDPLDLMITFTDGNGGWINTQKLNDAVNKGSQGNPYVTPDNKFLFYTAESIQDQNWTVKWVNIEYEIAIK